MPEQPSITAAELAHHLGGTPHGNGELLIHAIASLEQAGPNDLSWVAAPELMPRALQSKAGVVLLPTECHLPPDRTIIHVADPDVAICEAVEYLAPPLNRVPPGVHPSATVSPNALVESVAGGDPAAIGANVVVESRATIGAGTQLHPGVYVGDGATIGQDCVLWPNVVVRERVTIGNRVVIHPNATIGADGFGYLQRDGHHRKIPQIGTVVIEDDVEIGANTAIDRARSGVTRIGRGTKIDNLVQIGHNVDIGEDCIIVGQCGIGGSSSLERHVMLGGQTGVIDHKHLGRNVLVAAKSMVMTNIPDGKVVRGTPATDNHRFLREQASVRKLPKWLRQIKELTRRVEQLEQERGDKD